MKERIRVQLTENRIEERALREKESEGVEWEKIVEVVERIKGEKWKQFRDRHGDWGRNMVWKIAREQGRYKLREIGERSKASYPAVAMGLKRLEEQIRESESMKRRYKTVVKCLNVKC